MIGTLLGNESLPRCAEANIAVNNLDDLCGMTVATTRGSREIEFADEHAASASRRGQEADRRLAFNDGNSAAEALMSGRADCSGSAPPRSAISLRSPRAGPRWSASYTDTSYIGIAMPKGSDHGTGRCKRRSSI